MRVGTRRGAQLAGQAWTSERQQGRPERGSVLTVRRAEEVFAINRKRVLVGGVAALGPSHLPWWWAW